jgi:hypothetical protein
MAPHATSLPLPANANSSPGLKKQVCLRLRSGGLKTRLYERFTRPPFGFFFFAQFLCISASPCM